MDMEMRPLRLAGTYEVRLSANYDDRGYFMRVYDRAELEAAGLGRCWAQESESFSRFHNTVRGLHFQNPPHAETKLVRVVRGAVFDAFVDLRRDSETYGQWDSLELSADRRNMIYLPAGFAHGFCTLSDDTLVIYKMDVPYAPAYQAGIRWNDPALSIPWPAETPRLSPRDATLPLFDGFASPF